MRSLKILSIIMMTLFILGLFSLDARAGDKTTKSLRPNSIWKFIVRDHEYTVFPITYSKKVFIDIQDLAGILNAQATLDWKGKVIRWIEASKPDSTERTEQTTQEATKQSSSTKRSNPEEKPKLIAQAFRLPSSPKSMSQVRSIAILNVLNNVRGVMDNSQIFSGGETYLTKKVKEQFFNSNAFLLVPLKANLEEFSPRSAVEAIDKANPEIKPDAILIGRLNRYEFRIEEREWTTPLVEAEVEVALIDYPSGWVIWYNKYRIEDTRFNAFNTTDRRKRMLLNWILDKISFKIVDTLKSFKQFDSLRKNKR